MAGYKGVGVVFVRRLLRSLGADAERQATAALTEEQRQLYEACTATSWVPIELISVLAVSAAPLITPSDPDPLDRLGRALARDNTKGVYSFLFRVLTVEFMVKQSAKLWGVYHNGGRASAERTGPRSLRYEVRDYPDMPMDFRRYMQGFVDECIVMTGAANVRLTPFHTDQAWGYDISWGA